MSVIDNVRFFFFWMQEYTTLKIDSCVTMFVIAIMEYMVTDILKLTANYVKNTHHVEITLQDVKVAMCTDKVSFHSLTMFVTYF